MSMDFEIDVRDFIRRLDRTESAMAQGIKTGVNDVMDDWKRESTDLAPLEYGSLRRGIDTEVGPVGDDIEGKISSTAIDSWQGRPFDYAYYIHEVKEELTAPTTPGTIAKYLEKPAEDNSDRWRGLLERAIIQYLQREGW